MEDTGNVNDDGRTDVAFSNGWYESPANPRASWPDASWHPFTDYNNISNALLRDMNRDGFLDIVTSSGHYDGVREVRWYRNPGGSGTGSWQHTTIDSLRSPECLLVGDLDGDADLEIVTCDLDFSRWNVEAHNVYVYENLGDSTSWNKHNVSPNTYPNHKPQVVDVNRDGKIDIISESAGFSVVSFHENKTVISFLRPPRPFRIQSR